MGLSDTSAWTGTYRRDGLPGGQRAVRWLPAADGVASGGGLRGSWVHLNQVWWDPRPVDGTWNRDGLEPFDASGLHVLKGLPHGA